MVNNSKTVANSEALCPTCNGAGKVKKVEERFPSLESGVFMFNQQGERVYPRVVER